MSERTLGQAMAHADECRAQYKRYPTLDDEFLDLVLLADEILRLRERLWKGYFPDAEIVCICGGDKNNDLPRLDIVCPKCDGEVTCP